MSEVYVFVLFWCVSGGMLVGWWKMQFGWTLIKFIIGGTFFDGCMSFVSFCMEGAVLFLKMTSLAKSIKSPIARLQSSKSISLASPGAHLCPSVEPIHETNSSPVPNYARDLGQKSHTGDFKLHAVEWFFRSQPLQKFPTQRSAWLVKNQHLSAQTNILRWAICMRSSSSILLTCKTWALTWKTWA